jgi:ubiquitin-large subunit ribosomal protein L40e
MSAKSMNTVVNEVNKVIEKFKERLTEIVKEVVPQEYIEEDVPICHDTLKYLKNNENQLKTYLQNIESAREKCHASYTQKYIEEFIRFMFVRAHDDAYIPSHQMADVWCHIILHTALYRKICRKVTNIVVNEKKIIHYKPDQMQDKDYIKNYECTMNFYNSLFNNRTVCRILWPLTDDMKGGTMQIFIKSITGGTISLIVRDSSYIKEVKEMIQDKVGVPISQHNVIYGGQNLHERQSLQDYGIQKESTCHLVLRLRGC